MDTKLQILELLLQLMEKEPNRFVIEVTSKGIMVKGTLARYRPGFTVDETVYYSYFYTPTEECQYECNKQFEELIGGLKK